MPSGDACAMRPLLHSSFILSVNLGNAVRLYYGRALVVPGWLAFGAIHHGHVELPVGEYCYPMVPP